MDSKIEMTAERESSILDRAIGFWGWKAQTLKAIEELSELNTELARALNDSDLSCTLQNETALLEELADAHIMLDQLDMIFGEGTYTSVSDWECYKLEKLEKRLDELEADK